MAGVAVAVVSVGVVGVANVGGVADVDKGKAIIYIMLLSDLEKLLSVWENVLSIVNVI